MRNTAHLFRQLCADAEEQMGFSVLQDSRQDGTGKCRNKI